LMLAAGHWWVTLVFRGMMLLLELKLGEFRPLSCCRWISL